MVNAQDKLQHYVFNMKSISISRKKFLMANCTKLYQVAKNEEIKRSTGNNIWLFTLALKTTVVQKFPLF